MSKTKYNYAVVKSIFGDVWIGKTKLPVKEDKIFKDVDDAILKAQQLFLERHPVFDEYADVDDENYNDELQYEYEQISELENIETIGKKIERFITE